ALDAAHHLPAFANWGALAAAGGSRIITRGEGAYIFDAEGHRILDGMAGLWCVQIGYGREELVQAASEQMRELAYYNTFFRTAAPSTVLLSAKVAEFLGGELSHVFFNNSGSEAIDTIVRLVRRYWQVRGEPERTVLIARDNAYHGSTIAGVSLGGMGAMRGQGGPWLGDIEHILQPDRYLEGAPGESEETFAERAAQALEDRILAVGPKRVAAFIGEPVQGAGGVIVPPPGYWPRVEAICRKYGILLVCDEVICGFGRLGKWFGFQKFGVAPDLVSMAKGLSSGYLPISGVGVARHVVEVLREKGGDFLHGYTYSGHPTCAAVALANLEIMEREELVDRTENRTAPHLARVFASLADHPLVGEARAIGLLGAVEIVADRASRARFGGREGIAGPMLRELCIKNGLMVRSVRDIIVVCPPLTISHEEIDQMTAILAASLDEAEPALRALPA
ncbi:MAG: aminotransferase, partial [Caulobacteraceae bacterium]